MSTASAGSSAIIAYPPQAGAAPPGHYDLPFFYVFDGRGLTDGLDAENLSVQIEADSDFLLRAVYGLDLLIPTGSSQFRHADHGNWFSNPLTSAPLIYTCVPQKSYPLSSQIRFDLFTVTRAADTGVFRAFLGFQGVRRYRGTGGYGVSSYESNYNYYERPMGYEATFIMDPAVTDPVEQFVSIQTYDFELQRVLIANNDTALAVDEFAITLYHPNGFWRMMQQPVPISFIADNVTGLDRDSGFPVPPMVYPAKSILKFDILSLLAVADPPQVYRVVFEGVQRIRY